MILKWYTKIDSQLKNIWGLCMPAAPHPHLDLPLLSNMVVMLNVSIDFIPEYLFVF